jgi:hypothetical protein
MDIYLACGIKYAGFVFSLLKTIELRGSKNFGFWERNPIFLINFVLLGAHSSCT